MHHPVVNACDALSIPELLALLARCSFTVSNDTAEHGNLRRHGTSGRTL